MRSTSRPIKTQSSTTKAPLTMVAMVTIVSVGAIGVSPIRTTKEIAPVISAPTTAISPGTSMKRRRSMRNGTSGALCWGVELMNHCNRSSRCYNATECGQSATSLKNAAQRIARITEMSRSRIFLRRVLRLTPRRSAAFT